MIGAKQDAQVLYSALTFRNLLDSLARPGKIKQLAYLHWLGEIPSYQVQAGATAGKINAYALGTLLTLLDRETSFILAAREQWLAPTEPIMQWMVLRSGANIAPPDQAAFALFCDQSGSELITQLNRGTLLEPECSATAIYCIEQLTQGGEETERPEQGMRLELRGPGIEKRHIVDVLGLSDTHLQSIIAARRGYPLGTDVYLVDDTGRCIGLPRTTRIRVIGQGE